MKKALIVGSLNMDMTARVKTLPKLGETIFGSTFYKSCGGKGANQAVATAKLGLEVEMLGVVGSDTDGKELIENLKTNNIKSSIIIKDTITGRAIITVDDNGDNNIIVIPGANFEIFEKDIDDNIEIVKNSDIVILQNEIPLKTTEYTLKKSKELGKITIFNPAPACKLSKEIYSNTDYLILNETELEHILDINIEDEKYVERILKSRENNKIKNLIITLGDKGSIVFLEDGTYKKYSAYKVKAIDSTAAGDSFIGAFASKIINNCSIDEAIKYATAVSAIVVTRKGAQESIPNEEEIKEFIKNINNWR